MNNVELNNNIFDSIKHTDERGNEYWLARELMPLLEYKKWDKFSNVINDAKISCLNNGNNDIDHFLQVGKMIDLAKGAKRNILDYKLSRYACYLIAQNGDSRKKAIALAQKYFAVQTRKMEIVEEEQNNIFIK